MLCRVMLSADVAGLHWSVGPEGVCGLEVRLDGFSHKLHLLAARVFKALATAEVRKVLVCTVLFAIIIIII